MSMMRWLSRFALAGLFGLSVMCDVEAEDFSKYRQHRDFDQYFSKYTKRYFGPAFDWKFFKAQAIAESNLIKDARSRVGAQGIMQIMPRTYAEIQRKHKYIEGQISEPRWNIAAALWYDRQLFEFWEKDRSLIERLRVTFASYNAGKVNLLRAQRKAIDRGLNPHLWQSLEETLPEVTGKRSHETIRYVERIEIIKEDI